MVLGRSTHCAAALEAEIDFGRVGVTVIRAGLARLPTSDRDIPLVDLAEYSFHMFPGIERLLGFQIENMHIPLRGSHSSLILERYYGRKR